MDCLAVGGQMFGGGRSCGDLAGTPDVVAAHRRSQPQARSQSLRLAVVQLKVSVVPVSTEPPMGEVSAARVAAVKV